MIKQDIQAIYPLTPMQQGMLFHTLLASEPGVYVEQTVIALTGELQVAKLQLAWQSILDRYEVLRSLFVWKGQDKPLQVVPHRSVLPWHELDWRGSSAHDQQSKLESFLHADRRQGFDPSKPPLMRMTLIRTAEKRYELVWTSHHLLMDGWSMLLVIQEAAERYRALCRGHELELAPSRPYRDFIGWLQRHDLSKDEAFWREELKGPDAPTPLTVDRPARLLAGQSEEFFLHEERCPRELTSALRSFVSRSGITLSTLVHGAWALLLSRYSGEAAVLFGSVVSGRPAELPGVESMVGLFINTLPVLARVSPEAPVSSWLKKLQDHLVELRQHEHSSLVDIKRWSRIRGEQPLFESLLAFENYPVPSSLRQPDDDLTIAGLRFIEQTNYPLALTVVPEDELFIRVAYSLSRFEAPTIARLSGHFRTLLEGIVSNPDRRVSDIPLVTEAERRQLLVEWSGGSKSFPAKECLHERFEAQAASTPEAPAASFQGETLTYRELNRRANRLAHYLRERGVGPGSHVGLCAERSLDLVVGLIGILKAGGAYVPLDPAYPPDRLSFLMEDAGIGLLVAQQSCLKALPVTQAEAVCMDRDWPQISRMTDANPRTTTRPDDLAYVIYTSGSTGKPKGALITHYNVTRLFDATAAWYGFGRQDVWTLFHSYGFDFSVWELWGALLHGGRIVIVPYAVSRSPDSFRELLIGERVTVLNQTPSAFRQLIQADLARPRAALSLRYVILGGEALELQGLRPWLERYGDAYPLIVNMYGITETTVHVTYRPIRWPDVESGAGSVIGVPIPDLRTYVLDAGGEPVPIGVPGELYVGGAGVGRGYLRRPELSQQRFVHDRLNPGQGSRLYRSGDSARWLASGELEYLGRLDFQVKLRGFRIEPGEIEACIARHTAVREVVVIAREDVPGDKRLVAYFVAENAPADLVEELRASIRASMPEHMVPAHFVRLDALPLTENGKVDRRALPAPDAERQVKQAYVAPRTEWERNLASIWQEVLRVNQVGADDNFLDLGGHSLMMVRLISELNRRHKVNLGVVELFKNPSVRQMARAIEALQPRTRRQPAVVQMQQGPAELPVYFIYAGPDEFRLAQLMGERHPIYGIEVPWPLAWREAVAARRWSEFPTMDQLVEPYAAALRAHAGSSACVVAGHSFAGLIAFEAAHRLQRQGGKVEFVIFFDTWARLPKPYQVAWQKWRHDRSARSALRSLWLVAQSLLGRQQSWLSSFVRGDALDPAQLTTALDEQGMPLPWGLIERLYRRLEESYRPRRLDGRGILFRSESADAEIAVRAIDESLGWKDLFSRGLETISMAGDHLSMIREHNSTLAREMNEVLARHHASASRGSGTAGQPVTRELLIRCGARAAE